MRLSSFLRNRHLDTCPTPSRQLDTLRPVTRVLGLPLIKQNEMHALSRLELDYARNRFLVVQCEDYADRLLPDAGLIKTKVVRASDLEALTVSPLTDEFLKV
jgi:hypothetical protein